MFSTFIENVSEKCKENAWTDATEKQQFVHKDLPPENGFRGFYKLPRVLCERIDITPYLVNQKTKNIILKSKNSITKPDMKMFSLPCSVILVRENLENIKTLYNNNLINYKNNLLNTSPNLKKCKHCDKIYSSEKRLQNHVDSKHRVVYKTESKPLKRVSFSNQVIVHELKEYHHCRKCPKVYEDYQSLKNHMKQTHKKRKCYICFYCNKDFVDRMFFKVHIKMHCNLCGKFFVSKKKYNDHRSTVCRILKRYPCKDCSEIYFSYLSLKDHSFSHEGITFVCDICKERFSSKCPLLHHIQFLHCKKHPKTLYDMVHVGTDIMYECNSCDQCSNNKDIMENHTTILPDLKNCITTGYKDYYFCDQCSKQFDTETKMLRHKWTHFLKANENSKKCVRTKKESFKMTYKVGEELPLLLQPKLELTRLKIFTYSGSSLSKEICPGNEASTYLGASSPIIATNIKYNSPIIARNIKYNSPIIARNINYNSPIIATNINYKNQNIIQVLKPNDPKSLINNISNTGNEASTYLGASSPIIATNISDNNQDIIQVWKPNDPKSLISNISNTGNEASTYLGASSPIIATNISDNNQDIIQVLKPDDPKSLISNISKKPIVDPVSKKTLFSKHRCQYCSAYLSSGYCLRRHVQAVHMRSHNLQCGNCEEVFVSSALLQSHNCIRMNIPEMPFDDARPEIQFDNLHEFYPNINSHAPMDEIDFELPAPIVELTEFDDLNLVVNNEGTVSYKSVKTLDTLGYKITLQEVPIEF